MTRILYVEDNEDNVYMLRPPARAAGLRGAGGAATARRASRPREREQPDLILMDLSLPVLDGWEATRRLKGARRDPGDPDHRALGARDDRRSRAGARGRLRRLRHQAGRPRAACWPRSAPCCRQGRRRMSHAGRRHPGRRRQRGQPLHADAAAAAARATTTVTIATNGREALELVASRPFDLVLLDVMMPEMNGYEVLERLKADDDAAPHPGDHDLGAHRSSTAWCAASSSAPRTTCPSRSTRCCCGRASAPRSSASACTIAKRAHLAEIDRQRRRADELLHAILPAPAVRELKASDRGRAEALRRRRGPVRRRGRVHHATASATRPRRWSPISTAWRATFEEIAGAHGLEKIKTIGDAFMATANLLEPHADPVMASLRCAFDDGRGGAAALPPAGRCASASTSVRSWPAWSAAASSASTSGATR